MKTKFLSAFISAHWRPKPISANSSGGYPSVRRYFAALVYGVGLVAIVFMVARYKQSPSIGSLAIPGWGGTYCGRFVKLRGRVVLLDPNASSYALQELGASDATLKVLVSKSDLMPKLGHVVEVGGMPICKAFSPYSAESNWTVPLYLEEVSRSVID